MMSSRLLRSEIYKVLLVYVLFYTPRKLCLWEGIQFSRHLSDRLCVDNVLFPFNILKNHRWNFIKFCINIHMYKANTTDKKLRARGQYYWSYFPL